jgi:glucose/arabinose dehydrogenase
MARGPAAGGWRARRLGCAAAITAALLATTGPARAQLGALRVASGLASPTFVTAPAGDPRLFVLERDGLVRILSAGTLAAQPFLDIRDRTDAHGSGGLLGLAFPDDYAQTGQLYVYYTSFANDPLRPDAIVSRVSRFPLASASDADETREEVLFSVEHPYSGHVGGTIAIRDGFLYLGLGDGGYFGDPFDVAQSDASKLGKLLRFDLADESFAPQVFAKGLRNPFRFSFDRVTGDLWIGDVGEGSQEEIDALPAAAVPPFNFGWDVYEGFECYDPSPGEPACGDAGFVFPIYTYRHEPPSCEGAVTGGVVYRGSAIPGLYGAYFFADFCKGRIWSLRWTEATGVDDVIERTAAIVPDAGSIETVVAIGEDAAGELYFVNLAGGELFRLVPEPGASALTLAALAGLAGSRGRETRRRRLQRAARRARAWRSPA